MSPRPFTSKNPSIMQYDRVTHISQPGRVGIVTATTLRGDFQTYEVYWDPNQSSWYEAEALVVQPHVTPPIGFSDPNEISTTTPSVS